MIKRTGMVKRTHYYPRDMLGEIENLALSKGVSFSDIIRMAVKEYIKRNK